MREADNHIMLKEYIRPWKLFTLAIGIALLIAGSYYFDSPDWDIPVSVIMALLAYLTAPWCLRAIAELKWKLWPAVLLAAWFSVDGSYTLYWRFKNPAVLELMHGAIFFASLPAYALCGLVWYYRGSLMQLLAEAKKYLNESP